MRVQRCVFPLLLIFFLSICWQLLLHHLLPAARLQAALQALQAEEVERLQRFLALQPNNMSAQQVELTVYQHLAMPAQVRRHNTISLLVITLYPKGVCRILKRLGGRWFRWNAQQVTVADQTSGYDAC